MQAVFIGGCGRSGTTLLGSMLGAGKGYLCTPEAQFKFEGLRGEVTSELSKTRFRRITYHKSYKTWEIKADMPDTLADYSSYRSFISSLIYRYAEYLGHSSPPKLWVDHTPENIIFSDTLFKLYPKAKLIHLVRDGRAVAASVMPLDWGPSSIFMAAHWWLEKLSSGLAAETAWPEKVMRIRYEDLLKNPAQTLQAVCSFFEINYEEAMLKADGFKKPDYTAGQHALIGKRPDPSRLDAWKKKLSQREIEIFESITGDILPALGYDHLYGLQAREPSDKERIQTLVKEVGYYIANRFRYKKRLNTLDH